MFYPTAYTMRELRKLASSTQRGHLYSIKKIYEWAESAEIDIHLRLERKEYFQPIEYEQLANYLSKNFTNKLSNAIGNNKAIERLTQASEYLTWHAKEIISDSLSPDTKAAIENIKKCIDARKPRKKSSSRSRALRSFKKLNDTIKATLLNFIDNRTSNNNKPSIQATEYRTATMLLIYYETGCRKSEVMALQLRHYTRATGGNPAKLFFERTHDNPKDDRKIEPVVKTEEREHPISDELALMIETYLNEYREQIPNVSFDDSSHIFVTHLAGRNQGKALQISAFDSVLTRLIIRLPKLKGLHCHLLRHNWNYDFSTSAEKRGLGEKEESAERCYLMGWVLHSQEALTYNRRHIVESAQETAAELARTRKKS